MYNVYINERLIQFTSQHHSGAGAELVLKLSGDESLGQLEKLIDSFEQNNQMDFMILQSAEIDKTWKTFTELYKILEAAGGIVFNSDQQMLMIFRNGKWDLPKGKIEAGEEPDSAAIREVMEECGIGSLKLVKQLTTTYHTYPFNQEKILKKTFWFLMTTTDISAPVPQLEEGIIQAVWYDRLGVLQAMNNTYSSIASLLKEQVFNEAQGLHG